MAEDELRNLLNGAVGELTLMGHILSQEALDDSTSFFYCRDL